MDIREHAEFLRSRTGGQPLIGQKALVTGANSGIGRAVAIAMAEAGAAVAVNYVVGEDDAHAVAGQITSNGGRAIALRADVSSEDQVEAMFDEAIARFGTLDIVVANAGLQRDAPFDEMTLAQWDTVIDVNLTGQFLCARAAVREFLRRGSRPEVSRALGKIICMRDDADEDDRAGTGAARHPGQRLGARRDAHAHQHRSVVDARGLRGANAARSLQTHR